MATTTGQTTHPGDRPTESDERAAEAEAGGAKPSRMRLLLIDTDEAFCRQVLQVAKRVEADVFRFPPCEEGLEALRAVRPNVLLLSQDYCDSNAFALLQEVREAEESATLPVFLVSSRVDIELELRAYAAGATAVLKRDGSVGELTARLRGMLVHRPPVQKPPGEDPSGCASPVEPGKANTECPDVIVVEDDESLVEMLEYALSNRGYSMVRYEDGLEALQFLKELDTGNKRPVVLLDVDLPGLDGFRILQDLGNSRPGDYQVVLCTIHRSEAAQVLALQSGAVDYLVKPLRIPILIAKLERLVGIPGG